MVIELRLTHQAQDFPTAWPQWLGMSYVEAGLVAHDSAELDSVLASSSVRVGSPGLELMP